MLCLVRLYSLGVWILVHCSQLGYRFEQVRFTMVVDLGKYVHFLSGHGHWASYGYFHYSHGFGKMIWYGCGSGYTLYGRLYSLWCLLYSDQIYNINPKNSKINIFISPLWSTTKILPKYIFYI